MFSILITLIQPIITDGSGWLVVLNLPLMFVQYFGIIHTRKFFKTKNHHPYGFTVLIFGGENYAYIFCRDEPLDHHSLFFPVLVQHGPLYWICCIHCDAVFISSNVQPCCRPLESKRFSPATHATKRSKKY